MKKNEKKEKKIPKYLRDYNSLSMLEKLKYNFSRDIFTGAPPKTNIKNLQITFLGGAKTVTGSKYLLEKNNSKILIDCGLFQGLYPLRRRNWNPLPIHPKNIDAVVLTHAHLDHSGYLPLLVKNGFKGKIYCTNATYDLCKILLPDSGFLQEEDTKFAKKHKYSKHLFPKPLYTQKDAIATFKYFKIVNFNQEIKLSNDFSFKFIKAGHIIGAGSVILKSQNKSILFSGDLGRTKSPIVSNPETSIPDVDYVVTESTYGNRIHTKINPENDLEQIINETYHKNGKVVIPSFAVGRTQKILYYINDLKNKARIPDLQIFIDSPMSVKVTSLVDDYIDEKKLTRKEYQDIYKSVKCCITRQQSKKIFTYPEPAIILSASGMATGGRILHHIAYYGQKNNNIIVFAGYQAEGTRGRDLIEGKKEIKIHGEKVNIKAKVTKLENMSDHADSNEIVSWIKNIKSKPKKVFIIHGENDSTSALSKKIENELHIKTLVPDYLDTIQLE